MFTFLYTKGIKINSFSFLDFYVTQFYIKIDKKLILDIGQVRYLSKAKVNTNLSDEFKKNLNLLPKLLKLFQNIKIDSLKVNDEEFSIIFGDDRLLIDNRFMNLSSSVSSSSNTIFLDLHSLYLKEQKLFFNGKAKINYFTKDLSFYGNLHFENFDSNLIIIDITPQKIKVYLESQFFENLNFLKNFINLPEVANEWMYENVKGNFKIDWLYGEYDLINEKLIEQSIEGKAHIEDARIRFHKDVDEVLTKSIDVTFKNNNLYFNLIEPTFKDKSIDGSFVTIHNLTDEINGLVEVDIKTNNKLDNDILGILKAYDITLPILQKSGTTNAHLSLKFPYIEDKKMSTKGEFLVDNSQIFIEDFSFFSKKAQINLEDNMVYVEDASFLYEDIIDASVNLNINTNTLKSTGEAFINSLIIKQDSNKKSEKILEIKNKNISINMDFGLQTTINLKDLDTKIRVNESIFIDIENLSKIYKYSKLLQDHEIKDGNLYLEIVDKNSIDFRAFIKDINLPVKKYAQDIKDLDLKGSIQDGVVEIFSLNQDIKLKIDNEISLYLKDLEVFVNNENMSNTSNLKQNINLYLKNCDLNFDNKDFKIEDGAVFIKKDIIDFKAVIKDLDIPLKKDKKNIEEIELLGNYKKDFIKIYTKNEDLNLVLQNGNLSLVLNGYDIAYSTKKEDSSDFQNVSVIGKNSNILIDEKYEILADNYELKIEQNSKFAYLKHKDTQVTFKDTNGQIELYGADISAVFLNKILAKDISTDGKIHFFANGNINDLKGKIIFKDIDIVNLSILNNLLLLIQTSPALINPFLAIPSFVGLASNTDVNFLVYKILDGDLEFNYSKEKGLIDIIKLNTVGNGIDFEGAGKVDLANFNLDLNLNVIFFKDYTNIVGAIPVINYILLGDSNMVSTLVNISGSLEDPKLITNFTKDTFSIPTNIIQRILTSPMKLFDNLNEQDEKNDEK